MALFLRMYPSRQRHRLPKEEEAGEVTKSLAEVLGSHGCMVPGRGCAEPQRCPEPTPIRGTVS